ncbi:MAG TPA: hypothetical protein VGJ60_26225 [Chloroflexota bacterium]
MTVNVSLKVHDGLVFAADSATTLFQTDQEGNQRIHIVYNNANKIFNLFRELPIGAMTWGAGNLGPASMSTIAKDLRQALMGNSQEHADLRLERTNYSVEEVTAKAKGFFDELYTAQYNATKPEQRPYFGFVVGGYSSDQQLAEIWALETVNGVIQGPIQIVDRSLPAALNWFGDTEALNRLVLGFSSGIVPALIETGMEAKEAQQVLINITKTGPTLVNPPMPIQDAIDLAAGLVDVSALFARFRGGGGATIGGPVEVAAITKHERFKWVRRKHYYEQGLNPPYEGER